MQKSRLIPLSLFVSVSFSLILCLFSCTPPPHGRADLKSAAYDRTDFGTTDLAFWNGLTEFEIMALKGVGEARLGDPDALFALALFASGDVRDTAVYREYHKRIRDFVEHIRPAIEKQASDSDRGRVLYDSICRVFFRHRGSGDELRGYDFSESRFSAIFRNGTFNCVTSSLLYIICARSFGMKVKGVNIPSHMFVMLETREGQRIEIETTSRNGYDCTYTKERFDKQKESWFKARGLKMPAWEDYRQRQMLEPLVAVVQNMSNQHTSPARMAEVDRNRLSEAMGYCCPEIRTNAYNRLIVYNNEALYLHKVKDSATMRRFYAKVQPIVEETKLSAPEDTVFLDLLSVLELERGYLLFMQNYPDSAVEALYAVIDQINPGMQNNTLINNNAGVIVQEIIKKNIEEKKFEESIAIADRFFSFSDLQGYMKNMKCYVFGAWANDCWSKKEWKNTAEKLRLSLSFAEKDDDKQALVKNIRGATYNLALEYLTVRKHDEAGTIMMQCQEEFGLDDDGVRLLERIRSEKSK
jgi:hypothetical protein